MKHNVLFITSDQQHWSAMGYLNSEVKTPNLDRLVKRGMAFQRAYTVNRTRQHHPLRCRHREASLLGGVKSLNGCRYHMLAVASPDASARRPSGRYWMLCAGMANLTRGNSLPKSRSRISMI